CAAAFHPVARQVIRVPKLFGDHSALVGKVFHRLDEWERIAAGIQFVMTAFAGQNRPAATHTAAIKSTAVVLLSIAIVIIATPPRSLRQVAFNHPVNDFDGVAHDRIVGAANTEPDEVEEIGAHDITRRMEAAASANLEHPGAWISGWDTSLRVW